jgi:hypothetical protein
MFDPLSSLFNEAEADAIVNDVMARHKKERKEVQYFKDEDGNICQITMYETVDRQALQDAYDEAKSNLEAFDSLANPVTETLAVAAEAAVAVEAPTEPVVVEPTVPEAPAPEVATPEVIAPEVINPSLPNIQIQ